MTSTSSVVSGSGESMASAIETFLLTASAIRRPGWRKKSKPQRRRLDPKVRRKTRKARKEQNCATISHMFKLLTEYNTADGDVREKLWMKIHFLLISNPLHAAVALIVEMCPGLLFRKSEISDMVISLKFLFDYQISKINTPDARKALILANTEGLLLGGFRYKIVSSAQDFWNAFHISDDSLRDDPPRDILARAIETGVAFYRDFESGVYVVLLLSVTLPKHLPQALDFDYQRYDGIFYESSQDDDSQDDDSQDDDSQDDVIFKWYDETI